METFPFLALALRVWTRLKSRVSFPARPGSLQEMNQQYSIESLLRRAYPHEVMLGQEGQKVVQEALKVSWITLWGITGDFKITSWRPTDNQLLGASVQSLAVGS